MSNHSVATEDTTLKGITLLVLGLAVFSLQDVIMKVFSSQMAVQEVIFLRGLVTLLPVGLGLYLTGGRRAFATRRLGLSCLRGLAGFICFSTFSMALAVLPLADAMPLYYTAPLFVVMFSIPLLGETVGWRSWLAICTGFIGVVFVAQPSADGIEPAMILAVISACAYSAQSLLARILAPTESALRMTFYSMLTFVALSGALGLVFGSGWTDRFDHPSAQYMFRAWSWPDLAQTGLIVAVGLIAAAGFYCISQAYRLGEASAVAPFEYSSLPVAVLWGWLFWGDIPGSQTLIGSTLIVGGGLFILHREVVKRRRSRRPAAVS
ncbi:DMT family transporter [Leisingera sp. ANG-M1]|uniref:DMT family transporter n=1 Tax=Leisingera sp. ANG-M1 TaxID=1577895 RepID=UPI0006894808|nr:DMT family transporter [Leisingera sp. ANG-M1]